MGLSASIVYAAALALVFLALSARVVLLRRRLKVGVGSGGHEVLTRAMRAHGNFAEYVPLALVLLMLVEAGTAAGTLIVHALGLTLLVGRLLHGFFGLNRSAGYSAGRFGGTVLTWLMILVCALLLLGTAIGRCLL